MWYTNSGGSGGANRAECSGALNIYRCHICAIHINIILVTLLLLKKLFVIIISGNVYYVCENIYLLIKLKYLLYFIVQNFIIKNLLTLLNSRPYQVRTHTFLRLEMI